MTIYRWHKELLKGQESARLILHDGQPSTSMTEENINTLAGIIREELRGNHYETDSAVVSAISGFINVFHRQNLKNNLGQMETT